jgi:carboxyl-terminal processing protease
MSLHRTVPILLAALLACDAELEPGELVEPIEPAEPRRARAAPNQAAPAKPAVSSPDLAAMPGARQAFARTLELIDRHYVDRELDEDALYTGAIEGVLARLIQIDDHRVNDLLDPRALAELLHGTTGEIVGVGVEITFAADVLVVVNALPGGPAALAGLQAGDRILAIDGARVQGLPLVEVVDKIRGAAGTEVDLFVQRDTEEWHQKLERATITVRNVDSRLLDDGVGYLRLGGFADTTPAELDAAIAAMQSAGMRALVLDLRRCPGGLLEAAIAVTGRFLGDGQTIVSLVDRDRIRTTRATDGDGRWHDLPLAVLIGPDTASGAEILADALHTHKRATLIGERTLGKGTVEEVHELGNGWALKLSSARFIGASGEHLQGRGVRPHLPLAAPDAKPAALADLPGADDVVAAAITWLSGQPR